MTNDFLDNLGAHQYEKIIKLNSTKKPIKNSKETYDENFWEEYHNNTKEIKNN